MTAGAGAVLGIACSSSGVEGSAVMGAIDSGAPDGADARVCADGCGLVANPEAGDEHEPMGLVGNPEAGDENWAVGLDSGIVNTEAGDEQPVGVVANPEAGDEHEPMGLMDGAVGVVANPEAGHD